MTIGRQTVLAVVLAAAGSAAVYFWWSTTPNYALLQIRSAIEIHDLARFEKYVDTESFCTRLVDDVTAEVVEASASGSGAEALGASLGAGLVQLMKPRLVQELRQQLSEVVEQGAWDTLADSSSVAPGELANLVDRSPSGTWHVSSVTAHGKVATARLTCAGLAEGDALSLAFKMRDVGRHWQLVELENLREIVADVRARDERRLAEANAPIRELFGSSLELVRATNEPRADQWGISRSVDLRLAFQSRTDRSIVGFDATILVADDTGTPVKEVAIASKSPIAPSELMTGVWTAEIGMFDSGDQALYDLDAGSAKCTAEVTAIEFADGERVHLYESTAELPE